MVLSLQSIHQEIKRIYSRSTCSSVYQLSSSFFCFRSIHPREQYSMMLKSYERFLFLVAKTMTTKGEGAVEDLLHPTYVIDAVWHTHMLHPIGTVFYSVPDRFPFLVLFLPSLLVLVLYIYH